MKLLLSACCVLLAVCFTSCKRKLTEINPEKEVRTKKLHCYNGIADSSEIYVDCGGECDPCQIAQPACTPSLNMLEFDGLTYEITKVTCSSGSGLSMEGSIYGGLVRVSFASSTPDPSKTYSIVESSYSGNFVNVSYDLPSATYSVCNTGNVYVSSSNGKYTVTICNAAINAGKAMSAKMVCP